MIFPMSGGHTAAAFAVTRQELPGPLPGINHRSGIQYQEDRIDGRGMLMRIYGPQGTALATAAPSRRAASGSFAVGNQTETPATGTAPSLRMVGGIDALIALQGVEDPTERRRRSVKSGRDALDLLDELKVGMLGGPLAQSTLMRLKSAAAELKDPSGDPGLDNVLSEIDLRVEVELAKAGIR
jgi:hypothetical protein